MSTQWSRPDIADERIDRVNTLRISLFGHIQIVDDWSSEVNVPPIARALFAYLLLKRYDSHLRQTLADLFWRNYSEKRARRCLSTTLWRLRRALEPKDTPRGAYLLISPRGEIGFNKESDYWLDVEIFEENLQQILAKDIQTMSTDEAQQLEQALQLHNAELLEGFYDDWALYERERLRQLYLDGLAHLMRYYKQQGANEQSLAYGKQILLYDPLRESIHREIMRLYWETGRPTMATRQYQTCREILAAELNLSPMEETQVLHTQIISAVGVQELPTNVVAEDLPDLHRALYRLRHATLDFKRAQEKLDQATQLVEQLTMRLGQGHTKKSKDNSDISRTN